MGFSVMLFLADGATFAYEDHQLYGGDRGGVHFGGLRVDQFG